MVRLPRCILTVSVAVGACAAAAADAPRVEVDARSGNTGQVVEGQREFVAHTFVLRNTGGDTLRIREVRAGCHCTRTEFDSVIAPGGSGRLTQVVDVVGFHEGPFQRGIQVVSNAANEPLLQLQVTGILRSYVEIDKLALEVPAGAERIAGRASPFVRSATDDLLVTNAEFIVEGDRMAPWYTRLSVPLNWRLNATGRRDTEGYGYYAFDLWYPDTIATPLSGLFYIATSDPREPLMRLRGALVPIDSLVGPGTGK